MSSGLDKQTILAAVKSADFDLHIERTVDSTNNSLKKLAAEGVPSGYMLMAEEQTAGRGRMGRSFFSPRSGIYFSLLLRPHTAPNETLYFTTSTAVAICRAIEKTAAHKAQIKWVNDVYIGGKKVCGILTEASIAGGLTDWVVIGVGINIEAPEGGFPSEIAERAGALFSGTAPEGYANRLAAAVADEMFSVLREDRKRVMGEYRERCFVKNRDVTAVDGNRARRCHVIDIDDEASLIVRYEDGTRGKLYSGEVSLTDIQ
jgi:BirA family biotin operon repressor/biotin-[acetyl-CoA-carboxylase] ligase